MVVVVSDLPYDRERVARLAAGVEQFAVQYGVHIEASPFETILGMVDALALVSTSVAAEGRKREALTIAAERLLQYTHLNSPLLENEPPRADH